MGKLNLLVDKRYLVGVSKSERTSVTLPDGHASQLFALDHPCLRVTYESPHITNPDQDFFRGSAGRYWSFKEGSQPSNYNDFGYLNRSNYNGTFSESDIKQFNMFTEAYKVAYTIGGAETTPLMPPVWSQWPGRPDMEWPIEEIGQQSLDDYSSTLNITIPDGLDEIDPVTNEEIGPLKPWLVLQPLWPFFGYPLDPGSAPASLPGRFRHPPTTLGGPCHDEDGFLSPCYGTTKNLDNLVRKKLLVINSYEDAWVMASKEGPLPNLDEQSPNFSLTTGLEASTKWGNYWGYPAQEGVASLWESSNHEAYPGFMHQYAANRNEFFEDHAHKFFTPYGTNAPIATTGAPSRLMAKIEPKYNYFYKKYEEVTANPDLEEKLLPNSYMIYNYIDYQHSSATQRQGPRIGINMRGTYRRVNTFFNRFYLPKSRDQIANVGYGSPKRNYLQQYVAKAAGISSISNSNKETLMKLNSHIGFSQEMMESDFVDYGDREDFPYGMSIEFDTIMPGIDVNTELIEKLEAIPGGMDYIINNIILLNINQWQQGSTGQIPFNTYNESIDLSARVTEFVPVADTDLTTEGAQPGTEARHAYYGFDWVAGANSTWGWAPEASAAAAQQNGSSFSKDNGAYDLRCLDVGTMLDYANLSRKLPRYPLTPGGDDTLPTGEAPTNAYTVPCPIVGQSKYGGVGFERGILVGPKKMRDRGEMKTLGPRDWHDQSDHKTVPNKQDFLSILLAFERIIRDKSRSYLEMINGDLAYAETLAFKVCKHKVTVNAATGEDEFDINNPDQSFYFPNVTALNKIKYFDTQVKYGVKYKYIVYAYNLVLGNQYCYENLDQGLINDHRNLQGESTYIKAFYAHQFTSAKIIETPYFEFETVQIRDLPPVFPEIEVVPFKGVNNRIRFLMQTQNVKYTFTPEKFIIHEGGAGEQGSERYRHALQREFQQRPTGPIVFGSDDTDITFEIYRTTERPRTYTDFAPHLRATMPGILSTGQRAVGMSFDDVIEPNTKYYYTFRCTDYHGGLSIPSPIYYVEIVDDNGRMYPIVDVFYVSAQPDMVPKTGSKAFRKYLHIGAAFAQKLIPATSIENAGLDPASTSGLQGLLGTSTEAVWTSPPLKGLGEYHASTDKKVFKIRIISKNTGKKLDLNVRLEEAPIINPEEQS